MEARPQVVPPLKGPSGLWETHANIAAVVRALFTIKQLDNFAELCIFIGNLRSDALQQRLNLVV